MTNFTIVKGIVQNADAYDESVSVGDTEWQFSDGPSGSRSISYDFAGSLSNAIREMKIKHPSCTFRITKDVLPHY